MNIKKSILIITFGRKQELYETLKDISKYDQKDLEVLLLDNNETNSREKKIKEIFSSSNFEFKYYHDGKNYGVALGRNYIIEKSQGEILITLDDDIKIDNINLLIKKVENYFFVNSEVGCLAFNIKNYFSRVALRHEIPHGNKKLDFTKNMETYYFIGAGHAIKKEVYKECGLYPKDLGKYGGEEEDLSYRILKKYKILYCADLQIYHKVSPNGRMLREEENYYRYRNKLIVRNRYLIARYRLSNYIIWSLFYFIKQNGKLKDIIEVGKVLFRNKNSLDVEKQKLNKNLKSLKARLIY